jgi:hypothetical protein
MSRWIRFVACALVGLAAIYCGLQVPVHLRAVDSSVIERAGIKTPSLVERGLALAREQKFGAEELLRQAVPPGNLSASIELSQSLTNLVRQNPTLALWGSLEPRLETLLTISRGSNGLAEPFTESVIRLENREKVLEALKSSPVATVQELLRFRSVTNTVIFPPSESASGQALDAALSVCGLLLAEHRLTPSLSNSISAMVTLANRGGNPQPFELVLVDLMSLGQRFNWGQLTEFVSHIQDVETLHRISDLVRGAGDRLPMLFAAVELCGDATGVARYLTEFNKSGWNDLQVSLASGTGGVSELLRRNQRLFVSGRHGVFTDYCLRLPELMLMVKWLFYLAGGFLLAIALHFARPTVSALEKPLQVRGFHLAREFLFALGFLLVVLLVSEPFLAQESQRMAMPIRLRLPMAGGAVPAGNPGANTFMSQANLLTMLLFFVLQALLFTACLVKLAEIRRQKVAPRVKLKLLENEDHLFDAGLYLGFLGTIISFILYSLNQAHQFSLMVAYSSTSFGILFVVFFKIFFLRPARRKLVMETEAESPEAVGMVATPTLMSP